MSLYTPGMTRYYDRSPSFGVSNYSTLPTRKPPLYGSSSTKDYLSGADSRRSPASTSNYSYSRTTLSRHRSPPKYDASKYDDLEKRTRALQSSPKDRRPLPKGPGNLDTNHVRSLRTDLRRNASVSRDVGSRPVRADYTNAPYGSLRRENASLDRDRSSSATRLTRGKRTNSVADLTGRFEDMNVGSTGRTGRNLGSTTDLTATSPRRTSSLAMDDLGSPTFGKHSRTTTHGHNDPSSLPDISVHSRPSRSPSLDDITDVPRKGSRARNSSFSLSYGNTNGTNDRSHLNTNSLAQDNGNNMVNSNGIVGLRNIGNTCFMNSVLQCLSNTRALLEYCLNEEYKVNINTRTSSMKGELVKVFSNVMKSLWRSSNESYITPQEFKSQIARFAKRFVGYNQQDAQEFLIYLLEGLHEDINQVHDKKKRIIDDSNEVETISASEKANICWNRYLDHDNSKVVELFVGQLHSCLTCTQCGYTSNTFDPFLDLSLPISKRKTNQTLRDCFELFTQEEILDGDERPTCAQCKKRQRCSKRFSIQRFPRVLIIHLKRFNQGSYYRSKLSNMVDFPIDHLDLSDFASDTNVSAVYNLYAVSNHSGNTGGGHYTAYAKNPYTRDWHHFNDQRVSPISASRVVTDEGYVLFYERQGSGSHL